MIYGSRMDVDSVCSIAVTIAKVAAVLLPLVILKKIHFQPGRRFSTL